MKVIKNDEVILSGKRNQHNGMWVVDLNKYQQATTPSTPSTSNNLANGIIKHETPIHDLINYFHSTCFSPAKSTWLDAIKNEFFLS